MREFCVPTIRILPFRFFSFINFYLTNREKTESVLSAVELSYDVIKGTDYCVSL